MQPRAASRPPEYVQNAQRRAALQNSEMMFGLLFSAGGFFPWQETLSTGEWTAWELRGDAAGSDLMLRLACLKDMGAAGIWWQLGVNGGEILYEALLDSSDYSTKRLRARMSEEEPFEVPVDSAGYGRRGENISSESLNSVYVRTESVKVPAGSFQAEY